MGVAEAQPGGQCDDYHARHARCRRAFRSSDPFLEPQDESLHLRRPEQDPHHQSREDRSGLQRRAQRAAQHGVPGQEDPVRGHQARGCGHHPRAGNPGRHALRGPALAGRHAHQLQDHPSVDQAAPGPGDPGCRRHLRAAHQARGAVQAAHHGEARAQHRRHQGHGRPAGRAVRHRRDARAHRRRGSQQAGHSGVRHRRHQLRSGRRRFRHSGQ